LDPDRLDQLEGLKWLVEARNQIQTLLLELYERWNGLDSENRQFAAGAAFSLWRAVFLLAKKEQLIMEEQLGVQEKPGRVDRAAKWLIERVVKTNTIGFGDEMTAAHWMAGYYINNATYRVTEMQGALRSHVGSSVRNLRVGWNEAFKLLREFVITGVVPPRV
jgi:hypothetical protein